MVHVDGPERPLILVGHPHGVRPHLAEGGTWSVSAGRIVAVEPGQRRLGPRGSEIIDAIGRIATVPIERIRAFDAPIPSRKDFEQAAKRVPMGDYVRRYTGQVAVDLARRDDPAAGFEDDTLYGLWCRYDAGWGRAESAARAAALAIADNTPATSHLGPAFARLVDEA